MANEKITRLLRELVTATSERRIHWEGSEDGDTYKVRLGSGTLEIEREFTGKTGTRYVVYIKNGGGKILDIEFFQDEAPTTEEFSLAHALFTSARGDALQIDQVLDSMIDSVARRAD